MRKILSLFAVLAVSSTAFADTCSKNLMPVFPAGQAKELCATFLGTATLSADLVPGTDNAYDLGSGAAEFKDAFFDGTVRTDALTMDGEIAFSASGSTVALQEATAGAACMGTLTCNGASDVVTSTTCATTGSRIFLTRTSLDADTTGDAYVKSISTGVSFTVACELNDTGTLNWIIFHEAP